MFHSPYQSLFVLITSIVPVQNYITAIIIFLIVEMLMTWGFYGAIVRVPLNITGY